MTVVVYPEDKYNQELVNMLAPASWTNPEPIGRYNLVVVGAGPAGLVAAAGAAGLGAKVALVERHLMGGDCLNYGCVPSKALLKAAHKAHDSGTTPDFTKVMADLRQKRCGLAHHDSVERFTGLGIDVFLGDGSFISQDCIEVGGKKLNFHRAVITTGARAALPPIPGLVEAEPLINETLFSLEQMPRHLIVIGAGPIGCEMAQSFRRFGAEVTIIEMADRLVPIEDPDASAVLKTQFEKEGIELILSAEVVRADKSGRHKTVTLKDGDGERVIEADEILVAAGRIPNIEGLNLEAAGVDYHRRGVTVNERLQTTSPKIYAAGDICSPFQFTHSADAMAKIVIQNALFFGAKKTSALVMPWATYTSPEIAHVGMTAKEAGEKGDAVITYSADMSEIDRAVLEEETAGFARVHVERSSGRLLGATMVSSHAGESIGEMALAITSGLKMSHIGATIHPYPTQAEIWKRLANAHLKTSFTPRIAGIFKIFLQLFSRK
ncbi:MAG: mercuric reductase [Alphaproteobacteria bacterium]|nr:MAG: mercuric reductase [Alphaproteobacteria bacterium]